MYVYNVGANIPNYMCDLNRSSHTATVRMYLPLDSFQLNRLHASLYWRTPMNITNCCIINTYVATYLCIYPVILKFIGLIT